MPVFRLFGAPYYDSLIAKLIVYGDDRAHCLARLKRLQEFIVGRSRQRLIFANGWSMPWR